jgi:hypothetical protein
MEKPLQLIIFTNSIYVYMVVYSIYGCTCKLPFSFVNYEFLFIRLCVLIITYVVFCVFFFIVLFFILSFNCTTVTVCQLNCS